MNSRAVSTATTLISLTRDCLVVCILIDLIIMRGYLQWMQIPMQIIYTVCAVSSTVCLFLVLRNWRETPKRGWAIFRVGYMFFLSVMLLLMNVG